MLRLVCYVSIMNIDYNKVGGVKLASTTILQQKCADAWKSYFER